MPDPLPATISVTISGNYCTIPARPCSVIEVWAWITNGAFPFDQYALNEQYENPTRSPTGFPTFLTDHIAITGSTDLGADPRLADRHKFSLTLAQPLAIGDFLTDGDTIVLVLD